MSNYIVEDEVEDYNYYVAKTPKSNNTKTLFFVGIAILIVFIFIIIAFSNPKDTFTMIEEKMVEIANKYVFDNNIFADTEMYFDVNKLNISLPNSCSSLSGVIYDGDNFTPYLLCQNYESKIIENNESNYKLNGSQVMFLLKGMEYLELGYSGNDMSISSNISGKEGVYNVYYISADHQVLVRKVIILDNPELINYFPKMNLAGTNPLIIEKNTKLPLPTAIDSIDGDLTNNIVYYSDIDLSTLGEYRVIYNVKNSLGYESSMMRNIIVTEDPNSYNNLQIAITLNNENMTNQNVVVEVNVIGSGYDHTILPNGQETTSQTFTYEVSENGDYEFVAISKMGVENRKRITIKNIDRSVPSGTCKATIYSNKTNVYVNIASFNYIVGYNYKYNGKESGFNRNSTYTINESANNVSVSVRDYIGNETMITCNMEKGDPTVGNPNVRYYVHGGKEYVVANTKNDLNVFEKTVCNKISQNADVANCGDSCASFAFYYAAYLQRGNMAMMNLHNACHYNYTSVANFNTIANRTKRDALNYIFDEINRGKVMGLQVTGTSSRSSRHFVTVVGYRRNVYRKEDLREEDLLLIDAWSGCFSSISYTDTSKRTMYDNKDGYGYRIDAIRN